jgi:hypothetical protein
MVLPSWMATWSSRRANLLYLLPPSELEERVRETRRERECVCERERERLSEAS